MTNLQILCSILDKDKPIGGVDALLLAVIGVLLVFVVLILLMLVIAAMGKIFDGSDKLRAAHPEWNDKIQDVKSKMMFWKKTKPAEEIAAAPVQQEYASGSCGELKLINTDERDAAMIMAIVADSTGTPLNELRFKSIKKVETEGEEK